MIVGLDRRVRAIVGLMTHVLRYSAFTADPTGGNPAGIVLDAGGLDDARLQQIAADVGYSETAFAVATGQARRYALRFFSPLAEVAFCGHATVATAVAIAQRDGTGALVMDTPAGTIEVQTTRSEGSVSAALRSVPTRSEPAALDDVIAAVEALGWTPEDLDSRYPPHVAFAGNDHLILAARSRERLADLDYDFEALKALMLLRGWTTLQLFWRESANVIHSRNPFPVGGVVEDPATGAAAAALGGYLRDGGHITEPSDITIIQGEDMGRRSELSLAVDPDDPRVTVAGAAVQVAG